MGSLGRPRNHNEHGQELRVSATNVLKVEFQCPHTPSDHFAEHSVEPLNLLGIDKVAAETRHEHVIAVALNTSAAAATTSGLHVDCGFGLPHDWSLDDSHE
jgi:hypothetical protein